MPSFVICYLSDGIFLRSPECVLKGIIQDLTMLLYFGRQANFKIVIKNAMEKMQSEIKVLVTNSTAVYLLAHEIGKYFQLINLIHDDITCPERPYGSCSHTPRWRPLVPVVWETVKVSRI